MLIDDRPVDRTLLDLAGHPVKRGSVLPDDPRRPKRRTPVHRSLITESPSSGQSESYAREGIELDVSTLADWVDTCTASLAPLIHRHVLAPEAMHRQSIAATRALTKVRRGRRLEMAQHWGRMTSGEHARITELQDALMKGLEGERR